MISPETLARDLLFESQHDADKILLGMIMRKEIAAYRYLKPLQDVVAVEVTLLSGETVTIG
jgi:hypothetical protein